MGKLVVLKIIDGSFERGFTAMLQIGQEGERPFVETVGKLPPLPEMPLYYSRWQESYWRLDSRYRISAKKGQTANVSLMQDCTNTAQILKARFNTWLLSEEFRSIREKWLECLSSTDEIRIILQTEDSQLRQLPWHLLDFLERYPKAEFALSALNADAPPTVRSPDKVHVNILSVVGNSEGIDTQADQFLLASLPHAKVSTLAEPDRKQLNDELWRESWDIFFFAGHSSSSGNRECGKIFLNKTDSLSLTELKYALRKSVEKGLQLAIFNSCDGLGLARELADLRIPQIIVMREPVPDRVAQEFLKHFLREYATGTPLYLAVREARERLQGLEHQFPCATWLPLICQHPMVAPPAWQNFTQPQPERPFRPFSVKRTLSITLLTSLIATSLISGVRATGLLQRLEFAAFDQMTRLRLPEPPDPRISLITIDDEDIRLQKQIEPLNGASMTDSNLTRLLNLLMQHQPAAIGLDRYREEKTSPRYPQLIAHLRNNSKLIAICKVGYDKADPYGTAPPPEIPANSFRVGFSDFVVDEDEVTRRHLLAQDAEKQRKSICQVDTAFTVELALRYLAPYFDGNQTGFAKEWHENLKIRLVKPPRELPTVPHAYMNLNKVRTSNDWHPFNVVFPKLQQGAYQGRDTDTEGTQLLLNYRATAKPDEIADSKPLRWFLSQENPPTPQDLDNFLKGRIVLIGVTARSYDDFHKTPFGTGLDEQVPGVFIHAHMLSQLLSAVLDGRPLLWTWAGWQEWAWISGWAIASGLLTWGLCSRRSPRRYVVPQVALAIGLSTVVLASVCTGSLIFLGGWLPFVPTALGMVFTGSGVTILLTRQPVQPLKPL